MKVRCPACGSSMSLDALVAHDGAREALALAFRLNGRLGKALLRYLALFRPAQRELSLDRVAKLLGELLPHIEAARVSRGGIDHAAPVDLWIAGLEQMTERQLDLPLKSHGYLLEVVAGLAQKAAAGGEKSKEAQQRYRYHRDSGGMRAAGDAAKQARKKASKQAPPPSGWRDQLFNREDSDHGGKTTNQTEEFRTDQESGGGESETGGDRRAEKKAGGDRGVDE